MIIELIVYFLKFTGVSDYLELMQSKKFLTSLTLTIFLLNNQSHSHKLSQIFNLVTENHQNKSKEELKKLSADELKVYSDLSKDKLTIFELSLKYWESIVKLLLSDPHIIDNYSYKTTWIENLIFSLDFYLNSVEKLTKHIEFIENNNEILSIDEEIIGISKVKPDFKVVKDLYNIINSFGDIKSSENETQKRVFTNSQLTTLWSLVFEA